MGPLIILSIYAVILIWKVIEGEIWLMWKHYLGLMLLPVNYYLFWKNQKIGIIGLGATLLLGLFGLISYSPSIAIAKYWINAGDLKIYLFYGQPIFLLWLLIHFLISRQQYYGIGTKKYWEEFRTNPS